VFQKEEGKKRGEGRTVSNNDGIDLKTLIAMSLGI